MSDNSKILDKIKKLMRLSQSGNSNEASLALQRAKELMDKHQISLSDVALSDVKEVEGSRLKASSLTDYQSLLLGSLQRLFSCEIVVGFDLVKSRYSYNVKAKPIFIGVEPNPEIAAYCFSVLNRQLERDRADFLATIHRNTSRSKKTKRADDFAFGWVSGVSRTVKKLVPDFELPEIVTEAIKLQKEKGMIKGDAKARETGQKGTANWSDMDKGYNKGSKVELRQGMSGTGEQKKLN